MESLVVLVPGGPFTSLDNDLAAVYLPFRIAGGLRCCLHSNGNLAGDEADENETSTIRQHKNPPWRGFEVEDQGALAEVIFPTLSKHQQCVI